ncbi:diguanylate cyclase [Bradyrhizobium neotropicale]|uniref:Diguanylate cyclase n=2 Tax=Bradyrhizobium neotropicale TaxID=1497615 RepID=A0A176YMD3_9BRAD|nr:diguanylate cyclase [Bradyrhizobium neotropicale]
MKPRGSPASVSDRTSLGNWLRIGSQDTIDGLYWMCSADLLFAVRPSFRGHFAFEGINPAFESRLGLSSEDIRDIDIFDCMSGDDARSICEALRAGLAEGAEVRIRQRLALGGPARAMETTVTPIVDPVIGSVVRLIGCHREMRNTLFENTAKGGEGLDTNLGLASIQEGIQQRIASDLHDSTCQHLIAASLGLMRIRSSLGDPASAERLCDDIDASIDEALRELRAFAYLLHPRNLAGEGLKATIERYAEGFSARTSLRVTVDIVPDVDRLPYETKRSLLRVVQEALTNVFRHAKATEVAIAFEIADGRFQLTISDNGRGLPAPGKRGTKAASIGVGIPAMRARLCEIGGTLDIRSDRTAPHTGTVLCAVFPHSLATNRRNRRRTTTVMRANAGTQSAKEH